MHCCASIQFPGGSSWSTDSAFILVEFFLGENLREITKNTKTLLMFLFFLYGDETKRSEKKICVRRPVSRAESSPS